MSNGRSVTAVTGVRVIFPQGITKSILHFADPHGWSILNTFAVTDAY